MRVVWLLSLLALSLGLCAAAQSVDPDLAVLSAPQVDDVTLLQMEASAHSTSSSVSSLESELAAALASQAELSAELAAQHTAEIGAEMRADSETVAEAEQAAMQAALAEAEARAQADAEAEADAESVAALEAEFEAQAEAEVEAQQAAGIDSSVDVEAEADADSESESESAAELGAALEAELADSAEAEAEADSEDSTQQQSKAMAETHAESAPKPAAAKPAAPAPAAAAPAPAPVKLTGNVVDTPTGNPAPQTAVPRASGPRTVNRLQPGPSEKMQKMRKFRQGVLKLSRSDPNGAPDSVELASGKTLHKTWIVSPNLRMELPQPKPALKHSRERVLTGAQAEKFSRFAEQTDPRRPLSSVRRQFLRQSPQLLAAKLRQRAYSPAASWLLALRRGHFQNLRLDTPASAAAAAAAAGKPLTINTNRVTQHLTVRHHAPSVRQRAEVNALRAASRTLRRINSKAREFSRALRALGRARKQVQGEIHRHHVARAEKARKEASRAARRAAWSALLQHKALRRELLRHMARVAKKRNMSRAARRRAIAALIRHDLSPKQRAKLHAFIRHSTRRERRRASRMMRRRKGRKVLKPATIAAPAKPAAAAAVAVATAVAAAPAVSPKDQKAIEALVARIRASIGQPKPAQAAAAAPAAAPAASAAPAPAAAAPAAAPAPAPASAPAPAPKITPIRFLQQRLHSADQLAAEAEQEALAQLHAETELEHERDTQLQLHTEAQVDAAMQSTEEWIKQKGF